MNKDVKKILIVLALYAFAGGVFYNFQELWMAENNLSVNTISIVLSLCALISVSVIFLSSNVIKPYKLKRFVNILMCIKTIVIIALFFLNYTGLNILIKFLIMVDYAVDTEIYTCIYPLISLIGKDDKVYAVRGLIYDTAYYFGVILVSLLLGKTISTFTFSYNTYCLIAALFMLLAFIILLNIKMDKYLKNDDIKSNNDVLLVLIKEIKKDKISIFYLLFAFFGNVAYYSVMGILLTILTSEFNFEPALASNIKLGIGLVAVGLGALILSKLTLKNNYINISIKYVGRLITFLIAIIFPNSITFFIALLYTGLTSSSYSHVTDAPYINRFDSDEQLAFANLKEMISYLSRSVGVLLCGYAFMLGMRLNFVVASVTIAISIIFAYLALYNYEQERVDKNDR